MKFTAETTFDKLPGIPLEQLHFKGGLTPEDSVASVHGRCPVWQADAMLAGLNRLIGLAGKRQVIFYPRGVPGLVYLPADRRLHSTFYLLLAGGAYTSVCTVGEALPVAAELNGLGYDCFCLNYRVWGPEYESTCLGSVPQDDISAALDFIAENAGLFGLDAGDYCIGGFSAGGHAAALWGAREKARPPKGVILGYPMIAVEGILIPPLVASSLRVLYGPGAKRTPPGADPAELISTDHPPVYLAKAVDDEVISEEDTLRYVSALREKGVPVTHESAPTGRHGFGNGCATPFASWAKRAAEFFERERV